MSGHAIQLRIDIFGKRNQLAEVRLDLSAGDLIRAILQEFRDVDELGDDPAKYQLVRADTGAPLLADERLRPGMADHLILIDLPIAPPAGAGSLSRRVYLRDQERGKVFRLHWQPAVIGRRQDENGAEPPLAVNLIDHEAHDYISKRHVQIIEQGGQLMAESLTSKPTQVVLGGKNAVPLVKDKPYPIAHGDLILLVHSRVELRVIVDDEPGAP